MNDITYVGKHNVMFTVSRHAHESWEFIYCTSGSGALKFDTAAMDEKALKPVLSVLSAAAKKGLFTDPA